MSKKSIRDGFGEALVALGKKNKHVVALCGDLEESIRMDGFAEQFPERFFEVGVAEQNLVGIAAGLAKEGFTAFAGSYAAFSPGRTHDQIRVSVCYAKQNVKIVGGHAGLTVGPDGATHQSLEDIALMRVLPHMQVYIPSDYESAYALTFKAAETRLPVYLRLSRVATESHGTVNQYLRMQPLQLTQGKDLAILACGVMVDRALALAEHLKAQGIQAQVWNVFVLKSFPKDWLKKLASSVLAIITLEEHQQAGGFGSAIAEELLQLKNPPRLKIFGVKDTFGESGQADELLDAYGLGVDSLAQQVTKWI